MNENIKHFFFGREIKILKILKSMNLAKISFIDDARIFFVDTNFIDLECRQPQNSLSIFTLGGVQ